MWRASRHPFRLQGASSPHRVSFRSRPQLLLPSRTDVRLAKAHETQCGNSFCRAANLLFRQGGILHGGQIIALAAKRVNENSEERPISYFSPVAHRCIVHPSPSFFRLVQDLGHLAPPAKEIIGGADRCNQDRAQTIDQCKDQSLLSWQSPLSPPPWVARSKCRLVEENDPRFRRPGRQRNRAEDAADRIDGEIIPPGHPVETSSPGRARTSKASARL